MDSFPKRVTVPDRDDVGEVVQAGTNVGTVYCYAIYFPDTGECCFYDVRRCTTVT